MKLIDNSSGTYNELMRTLVFRYRAFIRISLHCISGGCYLYMAETLYDEWSLLSQVSFYPATGKKVGKGNRVCWGTGKPRGYRRLRQGRAGGLPDHGLEKEGFPRQSNSVSTWTDATGVFIGRGKRGGVDLWGILVGLERLVLVGAEETGAGA